MCMTETTGDRLKRIRKEKKLTLREVQEATGLAHSGLSEIEHNERSCNSDTLKKLATFYNVSTDYLLGIDADKPDKLYQFALYDGVKDFNEEQLNDVLRYIEFIKSRK